MNRFVPLMAAAFSTAALLGGAARAAAAGPERPTRVAVVNVGRVFDAIQETVDAKTRLRTDQQRLQAESKAKFDELQKLKAEGGNFRRGSEQYADWRQRMTRDWLILELRTSYTYPKDFPYQTRKGTLGVGVGLEMFFGTDEFLARPTTF